MRNIVSKTPSGKWHHLFICPDRDLFTALTTLLAEITPGSPLINLSAYPAKRQVGEIMRQQRPNLCFLDVGSNQEDAMGVLTELTEAHPGLPVIAINSSNNPDLILRCLRAGAREFLFQPFTNDQVVAALGRLGKMLLDTNVRDRQLGKVTCVMPGKGASGATTIACAVAANFARLSGKDPKVLLADLDPMTGMLAFILKLKQAYSFVEVLHHATALDESIWKGIIVNYQGFDLILSQDKPQNGIVERSDPSPLIDYARENYRNIVVDARGPYGDWGTALARNCDELLLVTTNELPTLHATQKALAHLDRSNVDRSKIRLIVNRFNPEAGLGREAIETALKLDVYEILPNDPETIGKALLEGKPLPSGAGVGKNVASMASRLLGAKSEKPVKAKSMFGSLFSSFLRD